MTREHAHALVLSNPERPGRERTDHANIEPRRQVTHPRSGSSREAAPSRSASRREERSS